MPQIYLPYRRTVGGGGPPEPDLPTDDTGIVSWVRSDTDLSNDGSVVTGVDPTNSWLDQTGNGNHYRNSGLGSFAPAYTASGPNGKPALVWTDGSQKVMFQTIGSPNMATAPYAVFALIKLNSWVTNRWFWNSVQNANRTGFVTDTASPQARPYGLSYGPLFDLQLSTWMVVTIIYAIGPALSTVQLNDDTEATGTMNFPENAGNLILGNFDLGGGAHSPAFECAAVITRNGVPDAATRNLHKAWLYWYGGVTP